MTTPPERKSRKFLVRVTPEVGERITEAAANREVSINGWINRAIAHALAHHDVAEGEPPAVASLPWSAIL